MVCRFPRARSCARNTLGIGALLCINLAVTACGAPPGTAVAVLVPPTATATATATATPVPTATATPLPPTATIAPTATSTPRPLPTATIAPTVPTVRPTTAAAPTPSGGYRASWRTWPAGEDTTNMLRRTYDTQAEEYRVAVLSEDQEWSLYAPEAQRFQDFVLEVEGRRIAGPDDIGYGLVFRRQPRQGDQASERYIFYVNPQGRFTFYQVTPDNRSRTLRPLDAGGIGVIRVGNEPNSLRVTTRGSEIILAINGTNVFSINNAEIAQAGEIGIFAKSGNDTSTEVAFKNLQLRPNP